jgi:hypothetical protein
MPGRNIDITILIYFSSQERTIGHDADPRFEVESVNANKEKLNTLLVIGWKGE